MKLVSQYPLGAGARLIWKLLVGMGNTVSVGVMPQFQPHPSKNVFVSYPTIIGPVYFLFPAMGPLDRYISSFSRQDLWTSTFPHSAGRTIGPVYFLMESTRNRIFGEL